MYPVTDDYLEAVGQPHGITCWADVYSGNQVLARRVQIVEGSITADAGNDVRYNGSVTLNFDIEDRRDLPTSLLNVYTTRIFIYSGMVGITKDSHDLLANQLVVPLGLYRVENTSRDTLGLLNLDLAGMESYVIDNKFIVPTLETEAAWNTGIVPRGQPVKVVEAIAGLIKETFEGRIDVVVDLKENPKDLTAMVENTTPTDRERWEMVKRLADSIDAVVYAGADGKFHIADSPAKRLRFGQFPAVWTVRKGVHGVLTSTNTSISRDGVYNAVVAHNDSVSLGEDTNDTTIYWAIVKDTDKDSPVRWGGPFGKKPMFISNEQINSWDSAKWHAIYNLNEAYGANREFSFGLVPNYALEPGDLVYVETVANTVERHQLVSLTMPLTHSGAMAAATKAKSDLRWITWEEIPPKSYNYPNDVPSSTPGARYRWNRQTKKWDQMRTIDDFQL